MFTKLINRIKNFFILDIGLHNAGSIEEEMQQDFDAYEKFKK